MRFDLAFHARAACFGFHGEDDGGREELLARFLDYGCALLDSVVEFQKLVESVELGIYRIDL